jgi:hypothetical protein
MTPGGWQDWEWDETLFAGAALYYTQGQLPYAEGLVDALRTALAFDGRGWLLDVGCGPGAVTIRLVNGVTFADEPLEHRLPARRVSERAVNQNDCRTSCCALRGW